MEENENIDNEAAQDKLEESVENQQVDKEEQKTEDNPFGYLEETEEPDELEETDEESEETDDEDVEDEPKRDENKSKIPNGVKKRFGVLTKRLRSEKEDKQKLINELEELKRVVGDLHNKQTQPPKQEQSISNDKEPTIDQFKDYPEFEKALREFDRKQTIRMVEEEQAKKQALLNQQKMAQEWDNKLTLAKKKYGDKWKKVTDMKVNVSQHVGDFIVDSEVGTDLMFFLANKPKELEELLSANPIKQIKLLTNHETNLKNYLKSKTAATSKKSPDPIQPVSKKSQSYSDEALKSIKDPNELDYEQLKRWFKVQNQGRKPF